MDFIIWSTFVVILAILIGISYRKGYKSGAKMVLDEWKKLNEEIGEDNV